MGPVGSEQAFHRAGLPELLSNSPSHLALIIVAPSQKDSEQMERGVAEKQAEVPSLRSPATSGAALAGRQCPTGDSGLLRLYPVPSGSPRCW